MMQDPVELPTRCLCNSPERALLLAVLIDGYRSATQSRGRKRSEAQDWMLSGRDEFLSYVYLCGVFGIDPDYLRSGLRRGYVIREQSRGIRSNNYVRPTPKRSHHAGHQD